MTSGIAATPLLKRSSHSGVCSPALDADQDGKPDADAIRVDDRDPPGDHAPGFELLDALPARCRGQTDPFRHLSDRQGRVLLQDVEEQAVDFVHDSMHIRLTPKLTTAGDGKD